jgi:hypothetical protein
LIKGTSFLCVPAFWREIDFCESIGLRDFIFWSVLLTVAGSFPSVATAGGTAADTEQKWLLTLVNGVHTTRTIGKATFNIPGQFTDHYLHGLALSRELGHFRRHFVLEAEGMLAWHRDRRLLVHQDYTEATVAALVRYRSLPWDHLLPASIAVGNGLSFTSARPKVEEDIRGHRARHLLNYIALELAVGLPWGEGLELAYRLHHRSGVFGLFGGVKGASDFYLLGLRGKL